MKKTYKIEVDCPTCAAKVEKCVKSIDGVEGCSINFMTQKLVIEAPREMQKEIISQAISKVADVDDDIVIYA